MASSPMELDDSDYRMRVFCQNLRDECPPTPTEVSLSSFIKPFTTKATALEASASKPSPFKSSLTKPSPSPFKASITEPSLLGKRSFSDFDHDNIDAIDAIPQAQSTPLNLLQRQAAFKSRMSSSQKTSPVLRTRLPTAFRGGFEPADPPKAVRLIYGCVAFAKDSTNQTLGFFARLWNWARPQPTPIVAHESPDRRKRRAVAMQEETHAAEQKSAMPGYYPEPSLVLTPPESRPGSSQGSEQQDTAQHIPPPSPSLEEAKAPVTYTAQHGQQKKAAPMTQRAQSTATRLSKPGSTRYTGADARNYGYKLVDGVWVEIGFEDDEAANTAPQEPKAVTPSSSRGRKFTLPADARPEKVDSGKKEHDEARDRKIDELCKRATRVSIPAPEVAELTATIRRVKLEKQIQEAEKVEAEEQRAQAAAIQEQLLEEEELREAQEKHEALLKEEQAKQEAQLEEEQEALRAEEVRRRAEVTAELIRPLDPEWEERVDKAMSCKDGKKVLATSVDGTELSRYDLGRLLPTGAAADGSGPSGWLNDETVNAWFQAIVQRRQQQTGYVKKSAGTPSFEAFNSGWYTTVNKHKDGIRGIKTWSRRKGIMGEKLLSADKIFFPVNGGGHWTLLIISGKERKIEYLDSMHGPTRPFFKIARDWLAMELGSKYDAQEWTESKITSQAQTNMSDCGAFACLNGLAAAKGRSFRDLDSGKMDMGRRMMVAVLLNGGFKDDWEL